VRIAHLTRTFLPETGGVEFVVHNLASTQAASGHRVTVVARWPVVRIAPRSPPYRIVPLVPTTFHWAVRGRPRQHGHWLLTRQLELLQRIRRFDVWHVHAAYPTGWAAVGVLDRLGVPALLTAHGRDIQILAGIGFGRRLDPEVDARVRDAVLRFPLVSAISRGVHDAYRSIGVAEERIRDIPNGVDVERIAEHKVDPRVVRARYGVPEHAELVLVVARNEPTVKGIDLIPHVASIVARACPRARWLVVGPRGDVLGPDLARRGVTGLVRLVPEQRPRVGADSLPGPPMLDLYRAADVFFFPSRLEGLPLAVLEAMAAGLPVVTTDTPGCRDLVLHDSTGLLCDVDDTDALAENVIRVLNRADERSRMGTRAQQRARRFAWRKVAAAYDRVYAELVDHSALLRPFDSPP
jgi:glycosyltransferase involved in cell wall biosynthesis